MQPCTNLLEPLVTFLAAQTGREVYQNYLGLVLWHVPPAPTLCI